MEWVVQLDKEASKGTDEKWKREVVAELASRQQQEELKTQTLVGGLGSLRGNTKRLKKVTKRTRRCIRMLCFSLVLSHFYMSNAK